MFPMASKYPQTPSNHLSPDQSVIKSIIQQAPRFQYPWNSLEETLQDQSQNALYLVGYGSLLNPISAARTITNTPKQGHPPVIAYGAKRVFDYVMPTKVIDRYRLTGIPEYPSKQKAALNTHWTGQANDVLNGRLIPLKVDDLDDLRQREAGYDLEPVAVIPWDEPNTVPFLGFVLCATERPWQGTVYVDQTILPYPPYLEVCSEGARLVDKDFEALFLDTCWLADKETPLRQYLSK